MIHHERVTGEADCCPRDVTGGRCHREVELDHVRQRQPCEQEIAIFGKTSGRLTKTADISPTSLRRRLKAVREWFKSGSKFAVHKELFVWFCAPGATKTQGHTTSRKL